jgi:hypothetical protein
MVLSIVLPLYQDTFGHAREMLYYPNVVFLVHDILASNVVLRRFFKKLAYFNLKCHFVYITKIHKHERTHALKKYAHNIPPRFPMFPQGSPRVPQCSHKVPQCLQCFLRFPHMFQSTNHTYKPRTTSGSHRLMHIEYLYYMIYWA